MSEHPPPTEAADSSANFETGLEALQSSPEFRGPVEPLDDHAHSNDHFALVYESREEQFAAAVPFVRQGLERGERCMYIADENSREEVVAAMRAYGVDVDAALESGQLSIHDAQETYLRNGTFDADETLEFIDDAVRESTEEYEALRMTGEMSSVLSEDPQGEELVRCEAKANYLFDEVDGLALCQYNRERFSSDVIRDVISTHPLLVHDQRVSHNVYYTPPEEFFGPDKSELEVDRLLKSLEDQTDSKAELRRRERFVRESYRITADPDLDFEEKLHRLLDLACERTGLDAAGLTHLPERGGEFLTEYAIGYGDGDGVVDASDGLRTDPGEGCYCRQAIAADEPVGKADVRGTDWEDDRIHRENGLTSYLGTKVTSGSTPYGTVWVGSTEPRDREFSETEKTFIELIGRWVSYELERRKYTDAQQELYEITADPDRSFDEKLDAAFELGCEQFDVDLGGLAKVDPDADSFEIETVSDDHDHLAPGATADLSDTYCRVTIDRNSGNAVADPVAITDPVDEGFEGALSYEEFGVRAYLGSYLEFEEAPDRTFWFVSTEPRTEGFSTAERAFHNLMGQWVQYELERRRRERELREQKEYLNALIETTPECIKTVNADGTLLQMNSAGLDMVEADSAAAVTGECIYDVIAPEDRERFREFNERICNGERETLEFDIVGLEGTRRHMESHAAPLHRPDGTTAHVALTRDVTEQVERERQLEETIERLEESNERLESFASMLAHELRNPVAIGQIYGQRLPDETDDEAVGYVTEAFDRIEDMIDVMLILTRGGEVVGERSPVELADVARTAWGDVDAPDASLDVDLDHTVEADETYVRHLFRNLLQNAVEHGSTSRQPKPDDAVEHGSASKRPQDDDAVEHGSANPRSQAHEDAVDHGGPDVAVTVGQLPTGFYVADDGPGIPDDDRDAVFEPGYTTASDAGGTGLGLAFVRKLAEVYDWDCTVTESADGGARFEFRNVA